MTAENRSDHDKKGHCTVANLKKGINCQYRIRNNCAYDLKQKQVFEEYLEKIIRELDHQFDIRSTDMSQDFWYNGKANITSDTVDSYFRGQLSNVQHTVGLLIYKTNVLEINFTEPHKFRFWLESLHKGNFSVIFPPLLLKRDGQCTELEYKNLLRRAIYYVVDIDIDLLNSFEIPELQRQVYNIIIRNDYDINTYKNYKKLLEVKNRILVFPFLFSMERTVVVHDICKLKCLCEQLGTKYKRFFENLNTYTSYIDFRPFAWGFADSLFRECHTDIEYQEKLGTLNYNKYLYERVLSEREENEDDGGFGLLHYDNDRIPTQHYVNSNGNKKTDSKQNNPLDYITDEHLNSSVKDEREHGMLELVKHYVKYYDIEQNSFCTENEKMEFNYFISRFKRNYFQPDKNGNISNDPYNLHLSLVFKKIIYDDPSNIPLVDDKTLLCHHIPSLDKISELDVLEKKVEQEEQFAYKNIHHHFCVDYNDSRLQPDQYERLYEPLQINLISLLDSTELKETYNNFKYTKKKESDMVTIHEDDSTIISIYFFRNDDRNRNFSMNGDISLNIFILRKTTGEIQTRKREIYHEEPKKKTKRSRKENEDDYESEPDDSVVSSEHDDDDSSYRPGSSEEDESSSSSSGSVSLLSDDLEVIAQQRSLDDDTMSSLTETSSIFFPSPPLSPMWTASGTGGNFSRLHDPNEEDGI